MYKFYKIFPNSVEKYVGTFHSTLDPEYHAYINWCKENDISWKLVRTSDNKIMYKSSYDNF